MAWHEIKHLTFKRGRRLPQQTIINNQCGHPVSAVYYPANSRGHIVLMVPSSDVVSVPAAFPDLNFSFHRFPTVMIVSETANKDAIQVVFSEIK